MNIKGVPGGLGGLDGLVEGLLEGVGGGGAKQGLGTALDPAAAELLKIQQGGDILPGQEAPPGVDAAQRAAVRQGALTQGSNLQHALLQQTQGQPTSDAFGQLNELFFGGDSSALAQKVVGMLNELGFNVKDLTSPEGQQAIKDLKEWAGFSPTGHMDFDLLLALLMAQADRDRQSGGGGGGGGRSGGSSGGGRASGSGGSSGGSRPSSGPASGNKGERMNLRETKPVDTSNWKPGKGDVTPQQLQEIGARSGHKLSAQRAAEVAPHLNRAMAEANIDTPKKKAAFVAQLMHESGGFKYNEEIASGRAYEGRRDLGNTQPGDGTKYKGRGFIQLTGRANYEAAGKALGLDLVNNPGLAAKDENAARVAAWYWNSRGLSAKAEAGNFDAVTKGINGGYNGKADRDRLYGNALNVLKDSHGLPSTGEFVNGPESTKATSPSATDGMSEAQKYDYYSNLIKQNGGTVDETPGKRSLVGVRTEDHNVNKYDDKMAVIWKDDAGQPHVREFDANMESISRYQGRYGNDVNGDGRRDLATLEAGTHEFQRDYSGQFGNILRPTRTTAVLRDTDGDGKGDTRDATGAGQSILFHKGGWNDTGSAGCQTMNPENFEKFWQALGGQDRFQYTVVDS